VTSILERYTSEAFAAIEHARLWPDVWLLAARAEQLASHGDFVVLDVGLRSALITRGKTGLSAFANACPHRANRLCDGTGRAAAVRCSYHGWTFGLDGSLRAAPGLPVLPEARLSPLAVQERHGFVWIAFSPSVSLERFLGPMDEVLAQADLDAWSLEAEVTTELDCNWKTSVDLHNEALHVPTLHPEIAPLVDWENARTTRLGPHARMIVSPRAPGPPVSTLYYLFPNAQINLGPDEGFVARHRPARDARRCSFDQATLTRKKLPSPKQRRAVALDDAAFGAVTGRDLQMAAALQRGMETAQLGQPAWTEHETILAWMHEELTSRLS
jgi:phenylpropionate dioxygenase-like ring-hydroxylating dioxygenase large terminal subunit